MYSISGLYLSIYEKLKSIHQRYEAARSQMETSAIQDEASKQTRIENLEYQLKKIDEYSEKLEYFRHVAEKHLESKNLLTISPRELNFNRLRNWAMMIDPTETDDPYAQRVYYQVKCNELFLERKKAEFTRTLAELKGVAESSDAAMEHNLKALRRQLLAESMHVLESEEFNKFSEIISQRHSTYSELNGLQILTQTNSENAEAGFGGYAKALPVFEELRHVVKDKLGDYCDMKNGSVLLPVEHSLQKEVFFSIGCSASKSKKLYRGLQNYLLNIISRTPVGSRKIYLLDALHFNSTALGQLRALEDSVVLHPVPKDAEQIVDTLKQIVSGFPDTDEVLGLSDSVSEFNATAQPEQRLERQILVLIGYPTAFSAEAKELIKRILLNYEHYGISPILIDTRFEPKNQDSQPSVPVDITENIFRIQMNQQELLSQNNGANHHFRWYELRQELSPSYVASVRSYDAGVQTLGTEYIKRIDMVQIPPYERGKKSIVLPYGVDSRDAVHSISFDNENFASYLMGASGSGKSTLLHTLITGILRNYHPDDVELWLADFKMSEFAQYINPLPPHVKYILLDESPELVYDLLDQLTEKMMERQRFFMKHRDMKKVENVPKDIYMPVIFVVLDEFSIMSQAIAESQPYRLKLQNLLAKGRALGIKFLFASQTFTRGISGLTPTAKAQIQSRIAMKNSRDEINETLELSSSLKTDQVRNWMDALPPHYALYKYRDGDALQIKRLQVMYFKGKGEAAYEPQRKLIRDINRNMKAVSADAYDPAQVDCYVDKQPVIVDGNSFEAFDPVKLSSYFDNYRSSADNHVSSDDMLLAFGSPRRMTSVKFATLSAESRENILLVARSAEECCGMAVILSAMESVRLQGGRVRVWVYGKNRLFRTYQSSHLSRYDVAEGIDAVCDEIRKLKEKIRRKQSGNDLIVMIGMERICADFEYVDSSAESGAGKTVGTFANRQKEREAELIRSGAVVTTDEEEQKRQWAQLWLKRKSEVRAQAKAAGMSKAEVDALLEEAKEEFFRQNPAPSAAEPVIEKQPEVPAQQESAAEAAPATGSYNAKEDFQYVVKQGSRLGYHFMLSLNDLADLSQTGLKADVFRYRMAFQISQDDSRMLFGNKHASALPEHICQYADSIERYSFRPYLHRGLTWEGWYVSDDEYKACNAFDI